HDSHSRCVHGGAGDASRAGCGTAVHAPRRQRLPVKEYRMGDLRRLLARDELLIAPGAYDGLTARLVELAGFDVVYATGAGISNSQLALADVGLITMSEMLDQVRKMTGAVRI